METWVSQVGRAFSFIGEVLAALGLLTGGCFLADYAALI
jgi:hypothetical protein